MPAYANPGSVSLRARLFRLGTRLVLKPVFSGNKTPQQRRRMLERAAALVHLGFPRGTQVRNAPLGGVPAQWLSNRNAGSDAHVLYLHGGAYVVGSPHTHRDLTSRLAKQAAATVVVLDYRLAPEHPFPAALDDALAAYRALLTQGVPANRVVLAGDSAGGGLSLACALAAREAGLALPAAIVCLSPWTDLSISGESSHTYAQTDVVLSREVGEECAQHYLGAHDRRTPLASPLYARLDDLPPVLIQVDDSEMLYDDSTRFAEVAHKAGVAVQLEIWHGLWHVWQIYAGKLPEADRALASIAQFVRRHTGRAA